MAPLWTVLRTLLQLMAVAVLFQLVPHAVDLIVHSIGHALCQIAHHIGVPNPPPYSPDALYVKMIHSMTQFILLATGAYKFKHLLHLYSHLRLAIRPRRRASG